MILQCRCSLYAVPLLRTCISAALYLLICYSLLVYLLLSPCCSAALALLLLPLLPPGFSDYPAGYRRLSQHYRRQRKQRPANVVMEGQDYPEYRRLSQLCPCFSAALSLRLHFSQLVVPLLSPCCSAALLPSDRNTSVTKYSGRVHRRHGPY